MADLSGKVAVVTGSSRGIGRAIAERLARDGCAVVVNYLKDEASAKEVVAKIESSGGRAFPFQADVTDLQRTRYMFDEAVNKFNQLNIVVLNAGAFISVPIEHATDVDYDLMFNLVRANFFALQAAMHRISGNGRIINISSGLSKHPRVGSALYGGYKAATEVFARVAAQELGERGITVNSVLPGATSTDALLAHLSQEQLNHIAQSTWLKRLGSPADIAEVVAFLASEQSRWLTGLSIMANGGMD